jgi:hypothetical protein
MDQIVLAAGMATVLVATGLFFVVKSFATVN